ncbi:Head fiber protein [Youngiibacter fragilis]|uniref:Head fiber protein n=1 Tax=Youngiibacter fragilis 232.1 TaxID=994573 RepID=V7I5M6_9CLOT|nr:Head fiber protein [Youngiibacter fragilis]ETA80586.1 Head fiber protein [Youngiibacter fragilis 232.1]
MSNVKNYTEQGGEKTVIGGTLEIVEGGQVVGLPSAFTPATFQADSTATTIAGLVVDFNALLAKLKAAGLMAAE